ncbi:MAG: ATP phosphoribosyltransferase [Oscillospiraceae bacterium]|jgi:ATP phosphoribosyltransferase|nr:ATP phosphoribosyltransferase [Oscillospiraceae bacterium]
MSSQKIRIALTKGRLEKQTVALFETIGFNCAQLNSKGRRLILPMDDYEVVLAKPADVLTYVEHGACDVGVVGKDTILEMGGTHYEMLDLGFGRCRFALAGPKGVDFFHGFHERVVATKYPNVAKHFFERKGMDVRIVKIEGSVELAPLLAFAHAIVDIVETGGTLRENGLEVIEEIAPISARVIVNKASMKLRRAAIEELLNNMRLAAQVTG